MSTLLAADYIVLVATLMVPIVLGLYYGIKGRKRDNREEYLLGGRNLNVLPVAFSLFVTFMSSASYLGIPAEMYTTGSDFAFMAFSISISYMACVFFVIPVLHPLRITSLYEYFELRFRSPALRVIIMVIGMFQKTIYLSVVMLSPALALQTVVGLPFWVSVAIVGAIGLLYTSSGGIRGVIMADVFQSIIMVTGIFFIIVKGVYDVGGLEEVWFLSKQGMRRRNINLDFDPRIRHSFWALILGGTFGFFGTTFDQSAIQRMFCLPTIRKAKTVYMITPVLTCGYILSVSYIGILAYSYFSAIGCDPFYDGTLRSRNQLLPYFAMQLFKDVPGMNGLILSAIFCSALSTLSSITNALAANTIEDLLKRPLRIYNVGEHMKIIIAKIAVWCFGGICIMLAFIARSLPGTLIQMVVSVLGAFGGPVIGIFFLGSTVRWANRVGAITGVLLSILFNGWLTIMANIYGQPVKPLPPAPSTSCAINDGNSNSTSVVTTMLPFNITLVNTGDGSTQETLGHPLYDISYQYYGLIGFLIAFIIGLIVSRITDKKYGAVVDPMLLSPWFREKRTKKSDEDGGKNALTSQDIELIIPKFED